MHMQALAMVAEGSVTVLSHPSLAGIASGSGISGSTAWHGAFRFRQYLKGVKASDGEQPESDLRELEFKKNQYGPRGETSCCAISAACSCLRRACPASTRRSARPRQKRCSWTCCAASASQRAQCQRQGDLADLRADSICEKRGMQAKKSELQAIEVRAARLWRNRSAMRLIERPSPSRTTPNNGSTGL